MIHYTPKTAFIFNLIAVQHTTRQKAGALKNRIRCVKDILRIFFSWFKDGIVVHSYC
jgi:hypothetical protein